MNASTINGFLNEIGLTDIQIKNDKFENFRMKTK